MSSPKSRYFLAFSSRLSLLFGFFLEDEEALMLADLGFRLHLADTLVHVITGSRESATRLCIFLLRPFHASRVVPLKRHLIKGLRCARGVLEGRSKLKMADISVPLMQAKRVGNP